jgi:hypothetical protein
MTLTAAATKRPTPARLPRTAARALLTALRASKQASGTADNTAAVVKAADVLVAALTDAQKNAIQYEKTLANRQKWSNFPTTFVQRNIHRA